MRLGVLDVGSNTVHLLVVDAHPGARPLPAHSHKADLRLAELLEKDDADQTKDVGDREKEDDGEQREDDGERRKDDGEQREGDGGRQEGDAGRRENGAGDDRWSDWSEKRDKNGGGVGGAISETGIQRLVDVIRDALQAAEDKGCEDVLAFATSAVREASNADAVLARVHQATGVALSVLTGPEEARLTFLAARRWFGWSAGKLLVLDIGGGSLETAYGMDETPDVAASLPLGAGRLTAGWLPGDPPDPADVRALRRHVRAEIARVIGDFARHSAPDRIVGTSKTFKQLARIAGAARSAEGVYAQRSLSRAALEEWVPRLAAMTRADRAELPGVSAERAPQLLAGALVAEGAMDLFGVTELEICPWALREGVILRRLDRLPAG